MENARKCLRNVSAGLAMLLAAPLIVNIASATGVPPPKPPCDRVTGGGYIITSTGSRASFAVNFGRNAKNELFVQVNYIDHGPGGPRIKAEGITRYVRVGADPGKRRIDGIANSKSNGLLHFTVIVDDNGEPGSADTFAIFLEGGYRASGVLTGGNIQLHHQCRPSGGPNR
ncbi:MAG: post-COAP-1 domain-containing protein [Pseudomonadota bacterium]